MASGQCRYEFRVWAQTLRHLSQTLERLAAPDGPDASSEVYLISRATVKATAKIRSGAVDIKLLVKEDRGLEQWQPTLKAEFPLDASTIAAKIFPYLALEPPPLSRSKYGMDEFLNNLIGVDRRIASVNVSKERWHFKLNARHAEFAAVTINGASRHTVAVESIDPEAVLQLTERLGIRGEVNTSYVREIKRVLGISNL